MEHNIVSWDLINNVFVKKVEKTILKTWNWLIYASSVQHEMKRKKQRIL